MKRLKECSTERERESIEIRYENEHQKKREKTGEIIITDTLSA